MILIIFDRSARVNGNIRWYSNVWMEWNIVMYQRPNKGYYQIKGKLIINHMKNRWRGSSQIGLLWFNTKKYGTSRGNKERGETLVIQKERNCKGIMSPDWIERERERVREKGKSEKLHWQEESSNSNLETFNILEFCQLTLYSVKP